MIKKKSAVKPKKERLVFHVSYGVTASQNIQLNAAAKIESESRNDYCRRKALVAAAVTLQNHGGA
jgi:uncharacterized protein (DUF1778 family)